MSHPDCLKVFLDAFVKDGTLTVFGNSDEAQGLPTLLDLAAYAKERGMEVRHLGYGCFSAEAGYKNEVFGFLGGGAMSKLRVPVGGGFGVVLDTFVGYSTITFPKAEDREKMTQWLRAKYPMTFAEADCRIAENFAKEEAGKIAERRLAADAAVHVVANERAALRCPELVLTGGLDNPHVVDVHKMKTGKFSAVCGCGWKTIRDRVLLSHAADSARLHIRSVGKAVAT